MRLQQLLVLAAGLIGLPQPGKHAGLASPCSQIRRIRPARAPVVPQGLSRMAAPGAGQGTQGPDVRAVRVALQEPAEFVERFAVPAGPGQLRSQFGRQRVARLRIPFQEPAKRRDGGGVLVGAGGPAGRCEQGVG